MTESGHARRSSSTSRRGSSHSAEDVLGLTSSSDLAAAVLDAKAGFAVADRKYRLKSYPKVFVGKEAVDWLIENKHAANRSDAVHIGNALMSTGLFHHVTRDHAFKDEILFYRFARDDPDTAEYERSKVSWAEFLGRDARLKQSLVPELPAAHPDRDMVMEADTALEVSPLDKHNVALLDAVHPAKYSDPKPEAVYNLVAIGAGAAGLVSAAGSAGLGARVAIIERHLMGGDCLNVGCVPSKALLRVSKTIGDLQGNAAGMGVSVGSVKVDFARVMERMREIRARIAPVDSVDRYRKDFGIHVFLGSAKFTSRHTVQVNGQTLKFKRAVVATGGRAAMPAIMGLNDVPYLTNSTIFNLTVLPKRLGVIGAGAIGCELGQAFQRFGSQVIVFARSPTIMKREDPDAARVVAQQMQRDGVKLLTGIKFLAVKARGKNREEVIVVIDNNGKREEHAFDSLLVSAGRRPNVEDLGLQAAEVEFDPRVGIKVNDYLQTTNPDIYAAGDVATSVQFTHVADHMARIVIRNALFFGRARFSSLVIPWATYTQPELAHTGLYPSDLEARHIPFDSFTYEFKHLDRAITDGATEGFIRVHVKKGTDELVGATVVGAHAGEIISELTTAIFTGTGLATLANVIHPYPTMAECVPRVAGQYNKSRMTATVRSVLRGLLAARR